MERLSIITGDIINSRKKNPEVWLPVLKDTLNHYGKTPINWEIFRGDGFQLELDAIKSLEAAIHIKAAIRQIQGMDVRISIGVGEKTYQSFRVGESSGPVYYRSGEALDNLKNSTLIIKTGNQEIDNQWEIILALAQLIMNNWTKVTAQTIKLSLENPSLNQVALAKLLKKSQSSVSEALKRGGFEEIKRMMSFYHNQFQ
jgi:hypothetical protein